MKRCDKPNSRSNRSVVEDSTDLINKQEKAIGGLFRKFFGQEGLVGFDLDSINQED